MIAIVPYPKELGLKRRCKVYYKDRSEDSLGKPEEILEEYAKRLAKEKGQDIQAPYVETWKSGRKLYNGQVFFEVPFIMLSSKGEKGYFSLFHLKDIMPANEHATCSVGIEDERFLATAWQYKTLVDKMIELLGHFDPGGELHVMPKLLMCLDPNYYAKHHTDGLEIETLVHLAIFLSTGNITSKAYEFLKQMQPIITNIQKMLDVSGHTPESYHAFCKELSQKKKEKLDAYLKSKGRELPVYQVDTSHPVTEEARQMEIMKLNTRITALEMESMDKDKTIAKKDEKIQLQQNIIESYQKMIRLQ